MVNYPNKKNNFSQKINYANRGMQLEDDINFANKYYIANNIAVIHKKPTPIQIVEVDYPMREKATIKKAFYKTSSTTDYNGVLDGKYIDFEAKETSSLTSFSLSNIHKHQFEHMSNVFNQKGIVFFIIRFKKLARTFVVPYKNVYYFYERANNGGRKSMKLEEIENIGFEVDFDYKIRLDYLNIIIKYESEFI